MKTIKIAGLLTVLFCSYACKDFDELQIDPNRATQAHPSLLLTNIEAITATPVVSLSAPLATRMMIYTDGSADEQYYAWQRAGFDRYSNLRQVEKMKEEAERLSLPNYIALALFFKSFHILEITKVFGDVPYSQAIQASAGTYKPAYDLQEDIYKQVLADLETANATLSVDNGLITGDIIYGGDVLRWKKFINSFKLRVLMSLSRKTSDASLNIETEFNKIVSDPDTYPIFTSNDDNAALHFVDQVNNRYPYFNNNGIKTAYYLDEFFVNLLKDRNDLRLFVMADRTPAAVNGGMSETDFDSYGGGDGSAPLAENTQHVLAGEISRVDARYYSDPINEPAVLMGFAELEFTLAEAAKRGWITADAALLYNNGIRASLAFYGISAADQDDYLAQPLVAYNSANGIEMIILQKYINFFMNGGWEAFYNNLRTGFPEFPVDGGGVVNNGQIPKRWMYPQSELQLNAQHLNEAISRQYPGGDDINQVMWLLEE